MSSYEYLSQQNNYYNLTGLEKLGHEWDLGIPRRNIKNLIDVLYINLKFLDIFLSLQTFTSTVCREVQDLFPYAAAEFKRIMSPDDVVSVFYNLEEQIWKAKLKIRAKYSFPEAALPLSFNVVTPEFVKRFIDTVVMNLSNLPEIRNPYSWDPLVPCSSRKQVEEVGKELKLLRSFVCFVSGRCKDPQSQHTLFNHILVVVGRAAMISWLSASFSDHQMNIQPIQSCICTIYVDILQALKSGWHPNIQTHEHVANYEAGFVETLVHCLEDLSKHQETVAFKDQRAIVQEIINFLRANLINPPRGVLEDFGTAIIDIGLLVCSLYENAEEKVLDFSGKIQSVEEMIYQILRKSFHSKLPKIVDGLGSIDIILDHLKELLSLYSHSLSAIKSQLLTIQQQLEHFQKKHDGFGSFAMQVIAKAYEAEHIVDCCINKGIPEWCSVRWTGDIIEEITPLMREVEEIREKKVSNLVLHNANDVAKTHTKEFARITSMSEQMVGFQEVIYTLRQQLVSRSSKNLDVISIVGMPGLGKTTLANKLFHDQLVVSHFNVRAQCCVSQVYTRKDLLLTILRGVKKDRVVSDKLPENELADKLRILHGVKKDTVISDELPENELADKLQKLLKFQRYLILIDDVWETAAWDDLYPSFYDANNGSRIILTTRLGDVASHAKLVSDPHLLRMFTPEESWMLLKKKVFNTKSYPPVLEDVGQKIAQKCGGLPLSVVLVAGILETMEKEKHCWEQVATNLGSRIQAKSEDIINLSYQHLPFHLKPCFLYFGVFSEDKEIQVSKLTWLWTAEGLVKSHKENHSEDIAENNLKNLIGRNLVIVSKKSSDGKTKACRIHELLLDFCKKKAKVENFLQCIKGGNDHMNPSSISHQKHSILPRLCLDFQGDNLSEWISIGSDVQSFHLMKSRKIGLSSIHHASYTFNNFKFLRVLNLEFTVIDSFPEALTCLRYAAVRIAEDSSLSFSSNLCNLETLIVKGIGGQVSLPDTLWKMVKLRHLHVYNRAIFPMPNALEELVKSPQKMSELKTLASVRFSSVEDANNILAKTPNLQKLKCEVLTCHGHSPAFNNLTMLEMLKFSWGCLWSWPLAEMNLPPSLKKLTLSNGHCLCSLDQVAILPRLVVLKLLNISIKSKVWKVTDKQFPHLKSLKLQSTSFFEWNVSDDAFPCLEHLVLRRLQHLEEIPSRFADMLTLKSIEVMACTKSLVESAKDIRKTQVDELQNCDFKLLIKK